MKTTEAENQVPYKDIRFANELKYNYPGHEIKRLGPIMAKLRSVKHPVEVDLIKQACNITRDAFKRVLTFMKPGVMEYEIEAEIIHEFIRQRATNSCVYTNHCKRLQCMRIALY
jgi:Xaa-Pro aminopeptidase